MNGLEFQIRHYARPLEPLGGDLIYGVVDLQQDRRVLHLLPFYMSAASVDACSMDGLKKQLRWLVERTLFRVNQSYMATTRGLAA